jgi:hypothetical protein
MNTFGKLVRVVVTVTALAAFGVGTIQAALPRTSVPAVSDCSPNGVGGCKDNGCNLTLGQCGNTCNYCTCICFATE